MSRLTYLKDVIIIMIIIIIIIMMTINNYLGIQFNYIQYNQKLKHGK